MRIDSSLLGQTINISNIPDILSKLNIGDVVRAQILDITANELLLQLFDGSKINASSLTSVQAKTGDFVNFVLKDKNNGQIFLETVKGDEVKKKDDTTDILKQLASQNIKPDDKNIEIVKELKSNNIPFSKDIIMKAVNLISNVKDLTPEKAVFIASNSLIPEEKNITALKQLTDEKQKVGSEIDQIYKLLNNSEDKASIKVIESKLASISKLIVENNEVLPEITTAVDVKSNNSNQSNTQNIINEGLINIKNSAFKNILNNSAFQSKIEDFVTTNYQLLTKDNTDNLYQKAISFLNSELKNFGNLSSEDQKFINDIFTDIINKLVKSIGTNEGKQSANPQIENANTDSKQKTVLQKFFNDFFVKVDSDNLKNDLNVKNIYKDLQLKMDILKEAVSQSNIPSKDEVLSKVNSLDNSVRFINEINNHNNYYQIPINMGEKNTTGELYILKRDSKKRKINPEYVTMFISLNTENIGQVDSLISVNKRNLSINIRVKDQRIIDFFKENYKELYDSMLENGFKIVDIRYRITDGTTANIVNVKKIVEKELNKNSSIDYKV